MYYGFANGQLVLYISIVKFWNKKKGDIFGATLFVVIAIIWYNSE